MPNIKHRLSIKAPATVVYKALTEQKGLTSWWTPQTSAVPEIGAVITFDFGEKYHNEMQITDLVPNRHVSWKCLKGDEEWVGTRFTFDLEESDEDTVLQFGHLDWRDETAFYASCNYNWGYYMMSLKSYCETGKGTPFKI
jgi:uncharacterized protein YndB with AHSA1/START domain